MLPQVVVLDSSENSDFSPGWILTSSAEMEIECWEIRETVYKH